MEAVLPQQQNVRRGELEEEDGIGVHRLPPRVIIGPDENGTRKVIEHRFDDEGNKVKVTTTSVIRKLARGRLRRNVIERRSWPKFGDAVNEDARSRLTMDSPDEILLERPRAPGSKSEEVVSASGDPLAIACIICGNTGYHWTSKCPYRELAPQTKSFADRPPFPFMMEYGYRIWEAVKRFICDDRCVRVTNLSEKVRESDLVELFGIFGFAPSVYLPVDKNTGSGRGIGFVQFAQRCQAEAAIKRLNGHTYDGLVLQVEWSAPGSGGAREFERLGPL
ncbi:unnamed protein product [Urochloa decumbens]|uniref:Eukaryotic translation initiation factor 3 subunit G n=1 Tax=Urochloa decumbens TaxID=240449 RepID=A0ABC8V7I0_9POAL